MDKNISTEGPKPMTAEAMSEEIGTMEHPKIRDITKATGIATPGAQVKDKVAYKQCVEQQKRLGSTNPWASCNATFGIGKSEDWGAPIGMSLRQLQKKESNKLHTDRSDAKKIMAAEKEHMKPTHPQTGKQVKPKNILLKPPVYKTEVQVGQSWNQLKKMQTEEPLNKKPR